MIHIDDILISKTFGNKFRVTQIKEEIGETWVKVIRVDRVGYEQQPWYLLTQFERQPKQSKLLSIQEVSL